MDICIEVIQPQCGHTNCGLELSLSMLRCSYSWLASIEPVSSEVQKKKDIFCFVLCF